MNSFSLDSVKEARNPIKPVNISVRINPTRVNTRTSSFVTVNSVEKIRTEVNESIYLALFQKCSISYYY